MISGFFDPETGAVYMQESSHVLQVISERQALASLSL